MTEPLYPCPEKLHDMPAPAGGNQDSESLSPESRLSPDTLWELAILFYARTMDD